MRSKIGILLTAFILSILGCKTENWDEHYNKQPETINTNVWEAVKSRSELSRFVELMVKYKFDTLFQSDNTYTLFVPDNNAIDKLIKSHDIGAAMLSYHISQHFIQPVDIQGKRKLQPWTKNFQHSKMLTEKPLTMEFH